MTIAQSSGATTIASGSYADAIFSSDGSCLYAVSGNTISVIDVTTGNVIGTYSAGTKLGAIDLSADGHYLAVVEEQQSTSATVYRIDLTNGSIATFSTPLSSFGTGSFYDVAFLADGTALVSQSSTYGAPVRLLDFTSGQFTIISGFSGGNGGNSPATLTTSADHTHVQIDPSNSSSYIYIAGTGVVAHVSTAPSDPYAGAALPPSDGTGVQATSPSGNLYVEGTGDVYDSSLNHIASIGVSDSGLAFSPDGQKLYSANGNFIFVWDTTDWQIEGAYHIADSAVLARDSLNGTTVGYGDVLQASPDGHYLSVITSVGITLVDLTQGPQITNGDDVVSGSGALYGLGGNDDLTSTGYGAWMYGGPGDDTYHVNNIYDQVTENPNEGHDTVHSTVNFYLPVNVEDLILEGTAAINGSGNTADNSIIGNDAANLLRGYDGNDHIQGMGGDDTLDGGTGDDILDGGAGTNTASYETAPAAVTVDLNKTGAQNTIGAGTDTLISIENLTGSYYNDQLTGDAGNNKLDGGNGADVLTGGIGDDTYVVDNAGDLVVEQPGQGHDVILAETSYTIPANVEELTLVSYGTATGNDLDNILNDGWYASNTLLGMGGNDTINGGVGGETLAGGAGADVINGGDGNDSIYAGDVSPYWNTPYAPFLDVTLPLLDRGSEVDVLNGGAGLDTIYAGYGDFVDGGADKADLLISLAGASSGVTVDFSALDNGGILTIGGGLIQNIRSVLWIEGSNYDDTIIGSNDGGDYGHTMAPIYGLGGNDNITAGQNTGNIYGGDGNDTIEVHQTSASTPTNGYLYGDAGDDTITVTGDGVVYPYATAYGGDGNDTLTLAGNIWGGAGNDTINVSFNPNVESYANGGAGDDKINGSSWGGTLVGGGGADIINGGDGIDVIFTGGTDAASEFVNAWQQSIDTGAEHDQVFGGGGDDRISSGYGDDVDGGSGTNDLLLSLLGATAGVTLNTADIETGNAYVLGGGTIQNIQHVIDVWGSNFEDNLTLSSATTVFGMDGNDTINGSSGADQIHGGAGADIINAGDGNDTIYVDAPTDIAAGEQINGGAGNDTLQVGASAGPPSYWTYYSLSGATLSGIENISSNGNTTVGISASQLATVSTISGHIALETSGSISLAGMGASSPLYLSLNAAGNQVDLSGFTPSFTGTVWGSNVADNIIGSSGSEYLYGNGGDDVITGGGGMDTLFGGAGNDTFLDTTAGHNGDTITDFSRGDRIVFTDATLANFTFRLSGDQLSYTGGTLTLANHNASIAVSAAPEGGVQITFSGPPIVVSAGAPVLLASARSVSQGAEMIAANLPAGNVVGLPQDYRLNHVRWHSDVANDHLYAWSVEHPTSVDLFGPF